MPRASPSPNPKPKSPEPSPDNSKMEDAFSKVLIPRALAKKKDALPDRDLQVLAQVATTNKTFQKMMKGTKGMTKRLMEEKKTHTLFTKGIKTKIALNAIVWSPDGKHIAGAGSGKNVHIWDIVTGRSLKMQPEQVKATDRLSWSPDGKYLAAGCSPGCVLIWETATGKLVNRIEVNADFVLRVAWSPNSRFLAAGCTEGMLYIWEIEKDTTKLNRMLEINTDYVYGVAWSPDGSLIASGGEDDGVRVWDASNGRLVKSMEGEESFMDVMWSPNGNFLAAAHAENRAVHIWDAATGRLVKTLEGASVQDEDDNEDEDDEDEEEAAYNIEWSPNGRFIAAAVGDKTACIWDPTSGERVRVLKGHSGIVSSVAWSPDGRILASAGTDDKTIRFWDVRDLPHAGGAHATLKQCYKGKDYVVHTGARGGKYILVGASKQKVYVA